jgi:hypothetical protein
MYLNRTRHRCGKPPARAQAHGATQTASGWLWRARGRGKLDLCWRIRPIQVSHGCPQLYSVAAQREHRAARGHPAPFPEELVRRLVLLHSYAGDTVYDPFMGCGTTPSVAHQLGRITWGSGAWPLAVPGPTAAQCLSVPMPDHNQDTPRRPAATLAPSTAVLAVWEAEDGRYEGCRCPMDRALARVGRDRRGERRLVCPDYKDRRPDPLVTAVVGSKTAGRLAAALGTSHAAAATWLAASASPGAWTRPPAAAGRPARQARCPPEDPHQAPGAHAWAAAAASAGRAGGAGAGITRLLPNAPLTACARSGPAASRRGEDHLP